MSGVCKGLRKRGQAEIEACFLSEIDERSVNFNSDVKNINVSSLSNESGDFLSSASPCLLFYFNLLSICLPLIFYAN